MAQHKATPKIGRGGRLECGECGKLVVRRRVGRKVFWVHHNPTAFYRQHGRPR